MNYSRTQRDSLAIARLMLIALIVLLIVAYAQERGWLPKI
jgi:hypothetical protein